jgi:hypothetical protein
MPLLSPNSSKIWANLVFVNLNMNTWVN